jgi:hypothetical protein
MASVGGFITRRFWEGATARYAVDYDDGDTLGIFLGLTFYESNSRSFNEEWTPWNDVELSLPERGREQQWVKCLQVDEP